MYKPKTTILRGAVEAAAANILEQIDFLQLLVLVTYGEIAACNMYLEETCTVLISFNHQTGHCIIC